MSEHDKIPNGREAFNAGHYAKAFDNFQLQSNRGDLEALWFLGLSYLFGSGTSRDTKKGMQNLAVVAEAHLEKGDPSFAYEVGRIYATGHSLKHFNVHARIGPDITIDFAEAENWFRRAANAQDNRAKFWIERQATGLPANDLYREMIELEQDNESVAYISWQDWGHHQPWLRALCDLDDAEACMELAYDIWDRYPAGYRSDRWIDRVYYYRKARTLGVGHSTLTFFFLDNESNEMFEEFRSSKTTSLYQQLVIGLSFAGSETPDVVEAYGWLSSVLSVANREESPRAISRDFWKRYLTRAEGVVWFLDRVLEPEELKRATERADQIGRQNAPKQVSLMWRLLAPYLDRSGR